MKVEERTDLVEAVEREALDTLREMATTTRTNAELNATRFKAAESLLYWVASQRNPY